MTNETWPTKEVESTWWCDTLFIGQSHSRAHVTRDIRRLYIITYFVTVDLLYWHVPLSLYVNSLNRPPPPLNPNPPALHLNLFLLPCQCERRGPGAVSRMLVPVKRVCFRPRLPALALPRALLTGGSRRKRIWAPVPWPLTRLVWSRMALFAPFLPVFLATGWGPHLCRRPDSSAESGTTDSRADRRRRPWWPVGAGFRMAFRPDSDRHGSAQKVLPLAYPRWSYAGSYFATCPSPARGLWRI